MKVSGYCYEGQWLMLSRLVDIVMKVSGYCYEGLVVNVMKVSGYCYEDQWLML